uniref:ATP synthase F0 subunit 8 n=1 Tax=Ablepharus sikimmensis TaxID=3147709 RepID=UPI0030E50CAA
MPQLNPAPWLLIMLLSWFMVLVFKTKTLYAAHISMMTTQNISLHHTTPWNWPWT